MTDFSVRLSALMEKHSVSNYRVHKDLFIAPSSIANWLEGKAIPDGKNLIKLADYFDVSIDYLVGRTDDPSFKNKKVEEVNP